ncbi:response regulator transcription factor [Ornithinibacillus sp. 179-J 7C1 HS]
MNGYSIKEIAKHSYSSSNTIKTHVKSIYRKLNVKNRIELIIHFK